MYFITKPRTNILIKTVNIAKYLLKYNTKVGFYLFVCGCLLLPGTISLRKVYFFKYIVDLKKRIKY